MIPGLAVALIHQIQTIAHQIHLHEFHMLCRTQRMWNISKNQRFVAKALNQKNASDCLASKVNIM